MKHITSLNDGNPRNGADTRGFAWQDGYGAFAVSKSNLATLTAYIETQREHHRMKTFEEEFVALLFRHGIDYKERYLWD